MFYYKLCNLPSRRVRGRETKKKSRKGTSVLAVVGAAVGCRYSCKGELVAWEVAPSNDRGEIVTVRYSSSYLYLSVLSSLSPSASPLLSFSCRLSLASARAPSAAWEDSGVSVTIGWEWCTNTTSSPGSRSEQIGGEWEGQSEEHRRNLAEETRARGRRPSVAE